ncbi:23S rRNA (uracil1939-C5)-methyltransferase [Lachnospiraceae bacterium NK3A20]|nr:23S rRNA (uracil1939-C5)-methyltransferase [Lachnospiraceae bacterium NK3A20]
MTRDRHSYRTERATGGRKPAERKAKGSRKAAADAAAFRASRCPAFGQCGGCTMIDTPMEEQLQGKQAYVAECIGDFGTVDPIIRMKNPGRYRNKVTRVFGLDYKGHPVCGNYRARSHEIVPVKDCLIEDRRADHIIQTIFDLLPSFRLRVYDEASGKGMLRAVQVRCAHATGQIMVTMVTNGPAFPSRNNFLKVLLEKEPEITTVIQNINTRQTTMILGPTEKVVYGPGYIEDVLCGRKFRLSSSAFYQVNSIQTEKLYNIAIDMAGLSGKERVFDAYCGIGTIGICASDRAKEVISVELNENAVRDAERNVKENALSNVQVYADDAGAFMNDMAARGESCDVLFMDPPRSGASDEFLQSVLAMAPKKIVYISCNPETLGDNLSILCDAGYQMKKAVPVDMFPFTDEVETVCLLSQRKPDTTIEV